MKSIKISENPFLIFLPFLIIYFLIAILFPTTGNMGDEGRYLMYAHNLLNGFFSPPPPNIDLGNGPGYPIVLMPFLALHLPLIFITILNAILYYLSIIFLFKSLNLVASRKLSFILSLFWAFYINLYEYIPIIYTETFTVFLISLISFSILKVYKFPKEKKYTYLSGFLIGYLALTKPIFGYVLTFILIANLILILIRRKNLNYQRSFLIILLALIVTSPYLFYNYSLTKKIYYWGSNGGDNLYWMTTPFEGEYGNWIEYPIISKTNRIKGSELFLKENHEKQLEEVFNHPTLITDSLFKKIAIENIETHPQKFLLNCISNIGRIVFNFPYSYKLEKPGTLLRLPFNGFIMVFLVLSIIPAIINWKNINYAVKCLFLFALIYLAGSIFGSAETRMFTMVVPILLIWIAYITQRCIKINLRIANN